MGTRPLKRFKLRVAFADYEVRFVKNIPKVGGTLCHGYCDFDKRRIVVWDNPNNPELKRATFYHEFFHAILRELGRDGLAIDESLIDQLANALMRVRIDHPDL